MKQKTIIQVWGVANSGKSETIKIAREELIISFINSNHTYNLQIPNGDINDILEFNGLKVGIESMGDYLWYGNYRERITNLISVENCDIVICASRIRNDVANYIRELADENGYRIVKLQPLNVEEPDFDQLNVNLFSARQICSLVDQIINDNL